MKIFIHKKISDIIITIILTFLFKITKIIKNYLLLEYITLNLSNNKGSTK